MMLNLTRGTGGGFPGHKKNADDHLLIVGIGAYLAYKSSYTDSKYLWYRW
jgi:hypothetical protein